MSLVDGGDGPDQIRSWHTVWPVFTQAHKCNYQFGRNTPALVRSIEIVTRHRPILPLDKQTCYYEASLQNEWQIIATNYDILVRGGSQCVLQRTRGDIC